MTRNNPDELRPCNNVEICQRDEAKSCDNCYDWFWRPHGPQVDWEDDDGEDAEYLAMIEVRAGEEANWAKRDNR